MNLQYLEKAIALAENAKNICRPNPPVGAVIVLQQQIIGEGWTQKYGSEHAEIQALKNCSTSPHGADLYVTLEPCCHWGKTPPCTDAIIKAGIKNVYIGICDPNPKVNQQGIKILQKAGIHVESGLLAKEIKEQLAVYLHWITTGTPLVIMKNAVSLDGKIAAANGDAKWITNSAARQRVHNLRSQNDAVLTTINTVQKDNPLLTVRLTGVEKQPLRIILDPFLDLSLESQICQTAQQYRTLIFYHHHTTKPQKINALQALNIDVLPVQGEAPILDFREVLLLLGALNITSVLVETGTLFNSYLIKNRLAQKIYYFIAPKILGGNNAVFTDLNFLTLTDQIIIKNCKIEILDDNILFFGDL